jgi:hypothetical protein
VDFSDDGDTLAVGASSEDGSSGGVNGDQAALDTWNSGAVYVFARDGLGQWSQQAYLKSSQPIQNDLCGDSVALSGTGDTLAMGCRGEDYGGIGANPPLAGYSQGSGAVYVFVRDGLGQWSQQAYVKASNTGDGDTFGYALDMSADGNTLAVAARGEDGDSAGIGGNQASDAALSAGAVYVLMRDGLGQWSHRTYVKASNPDALDEFGQDVALSADGSVLAVGAREEDGLATGIGGDQANDAGMSAGAVYLY